MNITRAGALHTNFSEKETNLRILLNEKWALTVTVLLQMKTDYGVPQDLSWVALRVV
jgi:hypothetical protein